MHFLAMVSDLLLVASDGSFIKVISVNNGLEGASISQQRDDYHDQLDRLAKPFKHGPLPGTEGLLADLTLVTFSFLTIPDDRLGSYLSSCRAGFVLAE
jgi:hypothetical protein